MFENDEELQEFMDYFGDQLPNPEHHPLKMMWLGRWWTEIVRPNRIARAKEEAKLEEVKDEDTQTKDI